MTAIPSTAMGTTLRFGYCDSWLFDRLADDMPISAVPVPTAVTPADDPPPCTNTCTLELLAWKALASASACGCTVVDPASCNFVEFVLEVHPAPSTTSATSIDTNTIGKSFFIKSPQLPRANIDHINILYKLYSLYRSLHATYDL